MRRALVLITVLASALLGTGLALTAVTAAASAKHPAPEIQREVGFELHSEGFKLDVYVTNNDGTVSAMLIVAKGPQVAYYSVPAEVTADRFIAKFGTFGELDYTFSPKGKGSLGCLGASHTENEAELDGTFTFTGENEYVHVDAPHAEGQMHLYPVPKQCAQARGARATGAAARRAVPYSPYGGEGATLHAITGHRRGSLAAREVSLYDADGNGPHRITIIAEVGEELEGVDIVRGVQMTAPSSAFHWNLAAGTASLRPPAPFTGSAKFTRHGQNGHGTWSGSLVMPVLGGEPVAMAGDGFRAYIHRGVPQDE
jgi:hypothetical protein